MVRTIFTFLTICSFVASCEIERPTPEVKDKTVVLYVIANNNLEQQGKNLINEIETFIETTNNDSFNLVVLFKDRRQTILLSNENHQLLKRKEYGDINCLSKETMSNIISDIYQTFPAKELGIVFWSHGTGWLPTGNNTTRSFGDDNGESIDIYDLADSIGGKFDYIIFDACYMGGVEVATEFQSKCRYFLASPSTVPTIGIIDATSIRFLIKDCSLPERLTNLCKYFHETKDVPISLIDLGKFDNFINAVNLLQINFDSLSFSDIATYSFRTNYIFFDLYSLFIK